MTPVPMNLTGPRHSQATRGCQKRSEETTGAYHVKQEEEKKEKEEWDQRMEQYILDSTSKPEDSRAYKEFLKSIKNQEEEMKFAPVLDIEAIVAEQATQLYKVARDSGNLKGVFQKQIKDAAIQMNAATVLTLRTQELSSATALESRLDEMNREIKALREENAKLRRALENIRKGTAGGAQRQEAMGHRNQDGTEWGNIPWTAYASATPLPSSDGEDAEMHERGNETPVQSMREEGVSGGGGIRGKGTTEETPLPPKDEEASSASKGMDEMEVEIEINRSQPLSRISDKNMESVENMLDKKIESALERMMYNKLFPMLETMIGEVTASTAKPMRPPLRSEDKPEENKVQTLKGKAERREGEKVTTLNPPARNPVPRQPIPAPGKKAPKNKGAKQDTEGIKKTRKVAAAAPTRMTDPAANTDAEDETTKWTTIVKRKKLPKSTRQVTGQRENPVKEPPKTKVDPKTVKAKRKVPRTAAVVLTCPAGMYEENMKEARAKISLPEMGVNEGVQIRRALTGAIKFEFPSTRNKEGELIKTGGEIAREFAQKLSKVLSGKEGVRVDIPMKMTELRVKDLDESVSHGDIAEAIAAAGECSVSDIKVGDIRTAANGMRTAWVKCPLTAGKKIESAGRLMVGWARVRVDVLENRPLQCFKCLEGGHVRERCPNNIDRSSRCYRCGGEGHTSKNCEEEVNCPVCKDKGLPSKHKSGSKACGPAQKGRRGAGFVPGVVPDSRNTKSIAKEGPTKGKEQVLKEDRSKPRVIEVQKVKMAIKTVENVRARDGPVRSSSLTNISITEDKAKKKKSEEDDAHASTSGAKKQRLRFRITEDDPNRMEATTESREARKPQI